MATPYDIDHLPEVASTQDAASARRSRTGRSTLVVADRQTAGRGRSGRRWLEPDVAMYSSFALERPWPHEWLSLVPLATAIALRRALVACAGVGVDLKWPNDVLHGGRKVGGILVEASGDDLVIGCGVNLVWTEPPAYATAISNDPGIAISATDLAVGWVDQLLGIVDNGAKAWPRAEYIEACVTLGAEVTWDEGAGTATTIDDAGALVVATTRGTVTIVAGDVHLRANL